ERDNEINQSSEDTSSVGSNERVKVSIEAISSFASIETKAMLEAAEEYVDNVKSMVILGKRKRQEQEEQEQGVENRKPLK
ncbi:hypothetical protein BGZ76_008447, partial [Entomortierella beljakovae]